MEYPKKKNPNIPSKTKSFQRLQNEEVTKLKIRGEKKNKLKILVI